MDRDEAIRVLQFWLSELAERTHHHNASLWADNLWERLQPTGDLHEALSSCACGGAKVLAEIKTQLRRGFGRFYLGDEAWDAIKLGIDADYIPVRVIILEGKPNDA